MDETIFDPKSIASVELNLLNGQVEIILRALELYGYNLEYMLDSNDSSDDMKQEKIAMLKYTYETVLSTQAEQVNGKSDNADKVPDFGRLLLKDIKNKESERKLRVI